MRVSEKYIVLFLHSVLSLTALVIFLTILHLNNGHFTYSLDDAYIHLAMSEEISKGGYGVNSGHYASASSSIIYPFLLSWAAPYPFHEYLPLIINFSAFVGSVEVIRRFIIEIGFGETRQHRIFATIFTGMFAISMNVLGVIFTGMEHSLQILASILVVYGLIRFLSTGKVEWWFALAIILGPMVRYENLAISFSAVAIIAFRHAGRPALMIGVVCTGLVALFSLFLNEIGLNILPNSVIAKSAIATNTTSGVITDTLTSIGDNFLNESMSSGQGIVLLGLLTVVVLRLLLNSRFPLTPEKKWFAVFIILGAGAHLLAGRYLFGRYEAYVFGFTSLGLVYLFKTQILNFIQQQRCGRVFLLGILIFEIVGHEFLGATVLLPLSANNIYEQQFQMHRFATQYLAKPVAVNDVGYVSYRNNNYVLDLWGLASDESLRARKLRYAEDNLQRLAEKHEIKVAMIYDRWFRPHIPPVWKCIAKLSLGRRRVSSADETVTFYATDPSQESDIKKAFGTFAKTLPAGVNISNCF